MCWLHRKFTRLPHLAGTEQNLRYAEEIRDEWLRFGLDSVELEPYDVLLSYPQKSQPNYISIVDGLGGEVPRLISQLNHGTSTSLSLWFAVSCRADRHLKHKAKTPLSCLSSHAARQQVFKSKVLLWPGRQIKVAMPVIRRANHPSVGCTAGKHCGKKYLCFSSCSFGS